MADKRKWNKIALSYDTCAYPLIAHLEGSLGEKLEQLVKVSKTHPDQPIRMDFYLEDSFVTSLVILNGRASYTQ